MHIEFSDEQMRTVVAGHLFGNMTDETKKALITEALRRLTEKPKDPYGRRDQRTQLDVAFDDALRKQAAKVAEEMLAEDSVCEKIRDLLLAVLDEVMNNRRDEYVANMANAMLKVFEANRC